MDNSNFKFIRALGFFCLILILPFPTEAYFLFRVIVFFGAIYSVIQVKNSDTFDNDFLYYSLVGIAIIYNPLIMVFLYSKILWIPINLFAGGIFFKVATLLKEINQKNKLKPITKNKKLKSHTIDTYTYDNGDKYTGEHVNGIRHGQGTYTYADGEKRVGEFKNGKMHGQGTITFVDGSEHIGEFKDGQPHGQGTQTHASGERYVGEYKNGDRKGQGTLTWPDGSKYIGEFNNHLPNGQGTLTKAIGDEYIGEFKNGKYHGQGTLEYTFGTKYAGEWKDGEFQGVIVSSFVIDDEEDKPILDDEFDDENSPF